jgi:hypothetical protein
MVGGTQTIRAVIGTALISPDHIIAECRLRSLTGHVRPRIQFARFPGKWSHRNLTTLRATDRYEFLVRFPERISQPLKNARSDTVDAGQR